MEYLIEFSQSNVVREIVSIASTSPVVQGVVLEIDPFWMHLWRLKSYFGTNGVDRIYSDYSYLFTRYGICGPGISPFYELNDHYIPFKPIDEYDIKNWRPNVWENYARVYGFDDYGLPIIIKICLLPRGESQEYFLPDFSDIFFPVVYETRPPAVGYP